MKYICIILVICSIILLFISYFIRTYDINQINQNINTIISPSDGTVMNITENENTYCVSLFLSIVDNHRQTTPYNGVIENIIYKKGEYNLAYLYESKYNKRIEYYINTILGPIIVKQYAGKITPNIYSYVSKGDYVYKGNNIGIILLGSRVDVIFPKNSIEYPDKKIIPLVHKHQKIYIGQPIAYIKMI